MNNTLTIEKCLLACDLNKTYLHFYPLVKKYWKEIVGVDTILVLIADNIPDFLKPYTNDIILFHPIQGINTAFQAQCIRILYPSLLNTTNGVIVSDMDLIPLQKDYYVEQALKHTQDSFIIYRNCIEKYSQYPICFCLATPAIWRNIFNIHTVLDIRRILTMWYVPDYAIGDHRSKGWSKDQTSLYTYLNKWKGKVIRLDDKDTGFNRLDRLDIKKIELNPLKYKGEINKGQYTDFHLPRPIGDYKDLLINVLALDEEKKKMFDSYLCCALYKIS